MSYEAAIKLILDSYAILMIDVDMEAVDFGDDVARGLLKKFRTYFLASLVIMYDPVKQLCILSKIFQGRGISFSKARRAINSTIELLKMNQSEVASTLAKIDQKISEIEQIASHKITPQRGEVNEVKRLCDHFYTTLIKQLQERLENTELFEMAACFEVSEWPQELNWEELGAKALKYFAARLGRKSNENGKIYKALVRFG